jgi:Flp pilus assembly protein TadG
MNSKVRMIALAVVRSSHTARACRPRAGQAMVELALVVPVLVVLLMGATDLARVFYFSIAVNNAARAGVQYGAQDLSKSADFSGMAQAALNDGSGISGLNATASNFCECPGSAPQSCSPLPSCPGVATYVEVQTSAQFNTLLKYPGLPSAVALSGNATMRVQ